jgi:hypothetical protein
VATADQEHQLQGARTQSLFRDVNERIEELNDERSIDGELLCECANKDCVATLALTRDAYEAVRRIPTHFFVLPGHEVAQIERVVLRTDRYVVVEKIGVGGKFAVEHDARRERALAPEQADSRY